MGRTLQGRTRPVRGDLRAADGVDAAVDGAPVVLHLATSRGRADVALARTSVQAARRAGVGHPVLIPIVGIDEFPWDRYRDDAPGSTTVTSVPGSATSAAGDRLSASTCHGAL